MPTFPLTDLHLRYRVELTNSVDITALALCEAFDAEWDDAQRRGLDADAFARECFAECDFDTLADIAGDPVVELNVEVLKMTMSGRDRDIPLTALTLEPFGLIPGLGSWTAGQVHSIGGAEVTIPLPERADVAKVLYRGDSGDEWDGIEAAVLKLNDGRLMAWETSWGPTGHGFCEGGEAEVWFAPETMLNEIVLQALTDHGREMCGIPREGFYIAVSGPEDVRTTARLRKGRETSAGWSGAYVSASECSALLDLIESARYFVEEVDTFANPTRAVETKLPMREALIKLGAVTARGVGNGPVVGRFVLLEVNPGSAEQRYVTSWDSWEECEAAFPIEPDYLLLDQETNREWLPGSAYDWEAART